jgi:hypothetical protein
MKRTIAMCGLLLAGFFAGALWIGIPVGAGGQGEPVTEPSTGDTNGDLVIDVSDAVYLLRYLFDGGEPPAACADSPALVARVEQLEENIGASEIRDVELSEAIDQLRGEVPDLSRRFVMAAKGLRATWEAQCSEADGRVVKRGDGSFSSIHAMIGGDLVDGRIEFETDRESDLLIEISYGAASTQPRPEGQILLFFDESDFSVNFPPVAPGTPSIRVQQRIMERVPAGTHTINVVGTRTCPPSSRLPATIGWSQGICSIVIHYLD